MAFTSMSKSSGTRGASAGSFEECEDPHRWAYWNTGANQGRDKIFEVRANYSDRMAVELLFRDDFIHDQKLYLYQEQVDDESGEIIDVVVENRPETLRQILKRHLTLYVSPIIYVKDGNYNDNRELYLMHVSDSRSPFELNQRYQQGTLEKLFYLWGRPVHLETDEITDDQVTRVVDTYDGEDHTTRKVSG